MDQSILKKYIPMTETTYYTLLSVMEKRHGYAIMQFVSQLTQDRIQLGTGTLYSMVGRLVEDSIITIVENDNNKKVYHITNIGLELLEIETNRLQCQLTNGKELLTDLERNEAHNGNN